MQVLLAWISGSWCGPVQGKTCPVSGT